MGAQLAKPSLDAGMVTADAGRLVAFYRDVLGFEDLGTLSFPGIRVIHRLGCGGSVLRVVEPEEPPTRDATGGPFLDVQGYRYLTLAVTNLVEVVEACRAAGGTVVVEPLESRPGMLAAQVLDPDGNYIELGQQD